MNASAPRGSIVERQKRWAPRTRTGCLTCRARRVKCDEAKPVCQRCVGSGRECTGYLLPAPPVAESLCATPVKPTTAELALSHYFKINITPFSADEFLDPFWRYSVPMAAHCLTPLWHASNAVAGLVWSRTPTAQLNQVAAAGIYAESAKQYSASTKHILKITQIPCPSAQDKTTVLLANILLVLYAFEIGDSDNIAAINNRSWQLIRYWKFWECITAPGVADIATQVLYFFIRASSFQTSQSQRGRKPAATWSEAVMWLQESALTSSTRAYLEIEMIWISTWATFNNFQQKKISIATARYVHSALCDQFKLWESRYEAMPQATLMTIPIHATVLDTQRILLRVLLQATSKSFEETWDEICWDKFGPEYLKALHIIESGLGKTTESSVEEDERWERVEVGFTPSLYKSLNIIAKACRQPKLRRRAATSLQSSLRSGLSKLPLKSRYSLTRYSAIYFLIDDVISLEEIAWNEPAEKAECTDEKKCASGEYICSRHRVAAVEMCRREGSPPEIIFVTIRDIQDNQPGRKFSIPAIHIG